MGISTGTVTQSRDYTELRPRKGLRKIPVTVVYLTKKKYQHYAFFALEMPVLSLPNNEHVMKIAPHLPYSQIINKGRRRYFIQKNRISNSHFVITRHDRRVEQHTSSLHGANCEVECKARTLQRS